MKSQKRNTPTDQQKMVKKKNNTKMKTEKYTKQTITKHKPNSNQQGGDEGKRSKHTHTHTSERINY